MSNLRVSVALVVAVLITPRTGVVTAMSAQGQTSDVPPSLKQSADCMLEVLKTVPGVSEPKLGYVTREGWTHPFLEYRAAERTSWVQPTRFEARRSARGMWFQAVLPGVVSPGLGLDIHVTDAVMKKWKTQCHIDAIVITV